MTSNEPAGTSSMDAAREIALRVEHFVRDEVIPFERDSRWGPHGPSEDLALELKAKARSVGLLCPHLAAGMSVVLPETIAVREAHRFDESKFEQWMRDNVPGFAGSARIEQFSGGQSNPTYKVTTVDRACAAP